MAPLPSLCTSPFRFVPPSPPTLPPQHLGAGVHIGDVRVERMQRVLQPQRVPLRLGAVPHELVRAVHQLLPVEQGAERAGERVLVGRVALKRVEMSEKAGVKSG